MFVSSALQAGGRGLYKMGDACICLASNNTLKGRLIFKECVSAVLQGTQYLIETQGYQSPFLNIVITQFRISDPFFSKIGKTVIVWGKLMHCAQKGPLDRSYLFIGCIAGATARTFSLLCYFDQLGTQSISTLIELDKVFLGGYVVKVGQSTLFRVFEMHTLKGFQNGLAIISNLCIAVEAIQTYSKACKEAKTEQNIEKIEPDTARERKIKYAKQILAIKLTKVAFKMTTKLAIASSGLAIPLGVSLLIVNIAQQLFQTYYIGENAVSPRQVKYPASLAAK